MGALRLNLRGAPPGSFSEVIFPSFTSGFAKVWSSVSLLSLSKTFQIGVLHTLQIMNCLSSYMMPNPVVTIFMHSHLPKSLSFELKRQSLLMKLYACGVPVPFWNLQGSRLQNKYKMKLKTSSPLESLPMPSQTRKNPAQPLFVLDEVAKGIQKICDICQSRSI